ncbi:MAG: hypothetical protein WCG66_11820 [bacterium]
MIDHFAELGLARRAWLEADEVKLRHHALMSESHPDKVGGDGGRAALLNQARRVLENPATRLRHLLELESPDFHSSGKPAPDWEFFSRTAEATRLAADVATQKASAKSPLARAVAAARATEIQKKLAILQEEVLSRAAALELRTKELAIPLQNPQQVSHLVEEWIFVSRWQSLLHEASASL